jgi:uncharacterized protein
MTLPSDWGGWERRFEQFLARADAGGDAAHDLAHIRRVVANAAALAEPERADMAVVLPAAWLHDCVVVAKDSPQRAHASTLAADAAAEFLRAHGYPGDLAAIHHAIAAHSFSAQIAPRTAEARVVQDADRLDALGAIGIARCLMLGGALGRRLYDPAEPFPHTRPPDDLANTVDHFYTKLLRLAGTMTTPAGRAEAERRTAFMRQFLAQLGAEIQAVPS